MNIESLEIKDGEGSLKSNLNQISNGKEEKKGVGQRIVTDEEIKNNPAYRKITFAGKRKQLFK